MKTITQTEANAIVAEKVHGWPGSRDQGHTVCCDVEHVHDQDGSSLDWCPSCGGGPYTPYSNNDQAFDALRSYCIQNHYSYQIQKPCFDYGIMVGLYDAHGKEIAFSDGVHNKESGAIVTALCSAELGEPVEIKEER